VREVLPAGHTLVVNLDAGSLARDADALVEPTNTRPNSSELLLQVGVTRRRWG
jgi:hypothetical protein